MILGILAVTVLTSLVAVRRSAGAQPDEAASSLPKQRDIGSSR